jgi:hypothetical protein
MYCYDKGWAGNDGYPKLRRAEVGFRKEGEASAYPE